MVDPISSFVARLGSFGSNDPERPVVCCLATATVRGRPSARMVLLKGVDSRGFVFFTGLESRKALDLAENPRAAMCLYLDALAEQWCVEGPVERVSDAEADAYFATRPRGSQIAAHASHQSHPLASRDVLEARYAQIEKSFAGQPVPRPAGWGGYRLRPDRIERWRQREDRLHERELYERDGDSRQWRSQLLQP